MTRREELIIKASHGRLRVEMAGLDGNKLATYCVSSIGVGDIGEIDSP